MAVLTAPSQRLHAAWIEAHAEWGPGLHEDGFGLLAGDDVDSPSGFAEWLQRLADESDVCLYQWIVDGDRVLGGIALRHSTSGAVERTGHIGYGVRPSARRRGVAGWALGRIIEKARRLGMDRVILVCAAGNVASAKTIESQGGVRMDGDNDAGAWRFFILTGGTGQVSSGRPRPERRLDACGTAAPPGVVSPIPLPRG